MPHEESIRHSSPTRNYPRFCATIACAAVIAAALCGAPCGLAQQSLSTETRSLATPATENDAELAARLMPLINSHQGQVGVAVKHLPSGRGFSWRGDVPMPTASLIKLPVMAVAYRQADQGERQLDAMIQLEETDKVPGSGILTPHFSAGTQLSLRDAIHLMIVYSDNTATNLVIEQIGLASTASEMEQLGLPHIKLHSLVYRRDTSIFPERSREFGLGSASAGEMVALLEMLAEDQLASPAACAAMRAHLQACEDRTKIVRDIPSHVRVAHKSGEVSASRCEAGLIEGPSGGLALCVLTTQNDDQRFVDDNAAHLLIAEIARIAYEHFNPGASDQEPEASNVLAIGSGGKLVEALQRTLNARLEPTPDLAVDGDFGPASEAAVLRFQQSHNLPANGRVDEATWKALGPLVEQNDAAETEQAASAPLPEPEPAEVLEGPPVVTCVAWAVGDAQTGELLWGENADQPRDIASTTKLMTAYLVARLAADDPSVLEETLTFSQRADDVIGSTSGVRAGEQLKVSEMLYGLLLPSGNDASVALAEHFGKRLASSTGESDLNAYLQFVAAMNQAAADLSMTDSHFANTSGLTEAGHAASARDLLKLAHAALALPLLNEIVATRRHVCTVTGPGGYQRRIVWKNTNRLLGITGYDGAKTGTTSAAGACLVARGEHNGRRLIVVTLGSSSSPARYADSRNLFRWAWGRP